MAEQPPSKEMDRQTALRLLGGWAMWSSPSEPDAELRAAARAVLHDRLAFIRQLEDMRVAAATGAFELECMRTALRGIASCSTCSACRGAATLALGEPSTQTPTPLREQLSDALVLLLNRRTYNDSGSRRSTILSNPVDDAIEAALTNAIHALTLSTETEQLPATHGRQRLGEIPAATLTVGESREAGEAAGGCSAALTDVNLTAEQLARSDLLEPDCIARPASASMEIIHLRDEVARLKRYIARTAVGGGRVASEPPDALELATRFHEAYERLAPSFGYETRPETREFDPSSKNGRLMVAVCAEIGTSQPPRDE